ncbi:hypothetical protein POJ06DRAFT_297576 [Lipomyces tetrasporus]|uniref:Transcription factor domain-containing protein n=1 Tax=Lipomyces tetrasporus TaxID=54092 RepID=A0AAD7VPU6_9ASCO|nr:uncharacterized protein POJ06DRAFT_297576 [Lipomyces tetrasporus]KAJ8097196.1 hypothetical protein POJ06DRAFT_297576 [Lipomyces tetrasporus]
MYPPVPERPKKTDIVRSRNGAKVVAKGAQRLGRVCESVRPEFKFRAVTGPRGPRVENDQSGAADRQLSIDAVSLNASQINVGNDIEPSCQSHSLSGENFLVAPMITRHRMPCLSLMKSLQRLDMDIFYSTYWEDYCLPALHPTFRAASQFVDDFPALKAAILTLSSCNFGRMQTEHLAPTLMARSCTFRPNITHQTRSMHYYSSAIKSFARLRPQDYQKCYKESSMGNFDGFNCHVPGLATILGVELGKRTRSDPPSKALLVAWMQCRFQVWWARTYFSSLEVQLQQRSVLLPRGLQESFEHLHERRVAVLSILCESHQLNFKATLRHWDCQNAKNSGPGTERSNWPDEEEIEKYCTLLAEETKKLDNWFAHLPPSERPLDIGLSSGDRQAHAPIEPVLFQSQDAALNYAYYAVSRIMQCVGFLHLLRARDPQYIGHESALLRCQDLILGLCIEQWLIDLEEMQPTEEGSFPVYQTVGIVKGINRQRQIGGDVFGVSLSIDDGGGTPKVSSYSSQSISTLLIHGKWRISGDLYTEYISIVRD